MLLKKQRSNELNVASSLIRMEASPPIMLAGLLPTTSITESLIQLCNEMVVMDKLPFVQKRNTTCMVRTIKLLSSLFEEIHETSNPLPPSSILCLSELLSTIRRVKLLIQECLDGSVLWNLTQNERLDWEFHSQVKEMGKALDILPLSLLDLSADVREQVELIHKQAKRAQCCVDEQDFKRKDEMVQMVANSKRNKSAMDCKRAKELMVALGLRRPSDYNEEIRLLEEEIQKQAGTGGLLVVHNINSLISFVKYVKCITYNILDGSDIEPVVEKVEQQKHNRSLSSLPTNISIPDEFRCPISLDLMRDPVIISSGHTYDRNSIAQWINAGHHSCPRTGQKLIHMALIPNYSLKTLIHKWCHENKVLLIDPSCSSSSCDPGFNKRKIWRSDDHKAIDHISATKTAVDAVRMTADFLVGKLATGSPDIQRQAAFELRLLAKTGMDNRRIIAEAGAIPFLTTLLDAHDARTQANAVTALLNLSIQENNKLLIMGAGAMDRIVKVLKDGQSMEARENAAATIFSMSMVDEYKIAIGSHPRAIPGLVTLLREGTTSGKRDAATALFSLSLYNANKVKAVQCGCIQLLAELLTDAKAGITDDALAVLALLSGSEEGLKELRETRTLVPTLIDLLRYGSPKGKGNSVTILLGMCRNGGEEVGRRLLTNPRSIPSLQCLASGALSMKVKRKSEALLRLLNRICLECHLSGLGL